MPTRFSPALRFPLRRRDCVLLSLSRHSLASRNYSIPLYMLDLRLWCFHDAAAPTPSRADFLCFCCCPFSTAFCILRFMLNFIIFYFLFIIHIFRRFGCFFWAKTERSGERENLLSSTVFHQHNLPPRGQRKVMMLSMDEFCRFFSVCLSKHCVYSNHHHHPANKSRGIST